MVNEPYLRVRGIEHHIVDPEISVTHGFDVRLYVCGAVQNLERIPDLVRKIFFKLCSHFVLALVLQQFDITLQCWIENPLQVSDCN